MYPMLTVEENLTFSARIRLPADFTHGQHLHFVEQAIQVGPGAVAAACLQVASPLGAYRLGWDSCGLLVQPEPNSGIECSHTYAVPEGGL